MNPNDLIQALISNRWYSRFPDPGGPTGIDPRTTYPLNPKNSPDFSSVPPSSWQPNAEQGSSHVEVAKPWKDLSPLDKFIMKFLTQPKIPDNSGIDLATRDPTNPLPQPLNPRLQFPNLAR